MYECPSAGDQNEGRGDFPLNPLPCGMDIRLTLRTHASGVLQRVGDIPHDVSGVMRLRLGDV